MNLKPKKGQGGEGVQYREDVSFFNTKFLGYLIIYFLGLCFVRVGHWVRQFFSFIYLFIY